MSELTLGGLALNSKSSISTKEKAIRGILANISAGLALKFQFNPHQTKTSKDVTYSYPTTPGWDHADVIFESGGLRKIKFDLFFDKTDGVMGTGLETLGVPLMGIEPVKAVIESFLYPQRKILDLLGGPPRFTAPPRGFLMLGLRFWEVTMDGGAEISDLLMNKLLVPTRMSVPLSFTIIEEGTIAKIERAKRSGLSTVQSLLSTAEVVAELFTTGGPAAMVL